MLTLHPNPLPFIRAQIVSAHSFVSGHRFSDAASSTPGRPFRGCPPQQPVKSINNPALTLADAPDYTHRTHL